MNVEYDTVFTSISPFEKPGFPHLPQMRVLSFENGRVTQPYMLEIWCEKSNPEHILNPICQRYRVNLVLGLGQMSVTETDELCQRIAEADKPTRIFYISDFDAQGISMGVAVARKLEFFIATRHPDLDVKLYAGMVTPQQVEDFALPRAPMKAGAGTDSFQSRYGVGGTELDAMTELKPTEFESIVTNWIKTFYDDTLGPRVREFHEDLRKDLGDKIEEINDRITEDDGEFHDRITQLQEEWNDCIKLLDDGYDKLEEWRQKAQPVWDEIGNHLDENKPELDDAEWPGPELPDDEPDALFDTERDFWEQLERYKDFQRKDIKRKGQR